MSARPWFKFYVSNWRSDPVLRSCTAAARGLWIDMLCLMHEASPRGHLCLPNGRMIDERLLSALCGMPAEEVRPLLTELLRAGVFSVAEDGAIFSRKMVRDEERSRRGKEDGKTGGNPQLIGRRVIPLRTSGGG